MSFRLGRRAVHAVLFGGRCEACDVVRAEQERGLSWSEAYDKAGRAEAAKALQRAFPGLCDDFTDQWFDKVVDIVLDTYWEWTEE